MAVLYQFQCTNKSCLTTADLRVDVDKRNDPQRCPHCRSEMKRVLTAPSVWHPSRSKGR